MCTPSVHYCSAWPNIHCSAWPWGQSILADHSRACFLHIADIRSVEFSDEIKFFCLQLDFIYCRILFFYFSKKQARLWSANMLRPHGQAEQCMFGQAEQ